MSEKLRLEFNRWALDGRAAELESRYLPFVEAAIERMDIQPLDRILEVGCGEGWAARLLARLMPEGLIVGLDLSNEMIHNARLKSVHLHNLMFIVGEAEEIPWQSDFFTKLLCVESFYYFEKPETALKEIFRVLSPGGSVWILNHLSKENELSLRLVPELKAPIQLLSAEEYRDLFDRCGFQNFSHWMVPDRASPSPHDRTSFPDAAELQRFRQLGALLMTATKPLEPHAESEPRP
jgi:arsenite methyltransferase